MRKYALLTLTLIANLSLPNVKAETYDYYVRELSKHPSVTQIVEQGNRFESLSKSAISLPDPHLILGVDNIPFSDPAFDRFLPSSKVIGFKQAIPNPKVRESKATLEKNQSKKQRLIAEYQIERLKALFTRQLIELQKVNELESLLKEQLKLYRFMEKDLRGQLEAGKSVYGRFSEIDVERSDIEQQMNDLKSERVNIQETLIELVEIVPQLSPPILTVQPWIRNQTPLYPILISQKSITIDENKISIAEADFKPNYGIQALYKQRQSGDNFDGDDWFSIQASISVPIWSKSNQTPKLKAAKAMKRSTQSVYEQSVRHWNQRMASLEADQKYALDNIELLKNKKIAIKEMIAAAERNYESGNTALEHVLDAQINHLNIVAKLVKQQSRYQNLIVEFNSHIQNPKIQNNEGPIGGSDATH